MLSRASNASGLDEASNEDARVQLRNLKTQQAVLGLNTRRQRLYLDNRAEGARNEQLEQAANLNPYIQGKLNFDPQQLDQLLMGNTVEENTALRGIAARLVDQQLVAEPAPGAIDVTLPERGRVFTFTRSLQVDGAAPLDLKLDVGKAASTSVVFSAERAGGDRSSCALIVRAKHGEPSLSQDFRRIWRMGWATLGDFCSAAEVGGLEFGTGAKVFAEAFHRDAAGLEHVRVVGDFEGEIGVLLDEQEGDSAIAVYLDNFFEDRADQTGREAEGGFVEHQEFRIAHQGAADGEHLLLAARKRAGDLFATLFQARKNAENIVPIFCNERTVALEIRPHREIFVDREIAEDHATPQALGKGPAPQLVRRQSSEVFAQKFDAPALRPEQSGQRAQGRAFARAV